MIHSPISSVPAVPSADELPSAGETGEEMLRAAIASTLAVEPRQRADLFERLTGEIAAITTAPGSEMRPWTRTVHAGVDGSRIFSGGVGLSIVVDPEGRLWRGRTYEDFATTYRLGDGTCEVESMEPRYAQMREYGLGTPGSPLQLDAEGAGEAAAAGGGELDGAAAAGAGDPAEL